MQRTLAHSGPSLDREIAELVDAIVQAVDVDRSAEVDRLRAALEPFGGSELYAAEIRLCGQPSIDEWCICGGAIF